MISYGWFDRRDFGMDAMDSLQSLLELLLRLKFEFAFIKYSKFDVSKISFCLGTLLESALHQDLRILDTKFSANAIVPFTLR